MARTQKQKILHFFVYPVMGLAVVALLSYALIIRPLQIRNQKQQFEKAEASLDALATQIEQTIGKPDDTKKEKSCSYQNQAYGRGKRSCSINIAFLYSNKEAVSSSTLMQKISNLFKSNLEDSRGQKDMGTFSPKATTRGDQVFYQNLDELADIRCSIEYIYPMGVRVDQPFEPVFEENLEISFSCSNFAKTEFYPTKSKY